MSEIARSDELYVFAGPLYAIHANGGVYAIFGTPNAALYFVRGLDARSRQFFHIENVAGERVRIEDNPWSPGHAAAILDTLRTAADA